MFWAVSCRDMQVDVVEPRNRDIPNGHREAEGAEVVRVTDIDIRDTIRQSDMHVPLN